MKKIKMSLFVLLSAFALNACKETGSNKAQSPASSVNEIAKADSTVVSTPEETKDIAITQNEKPKNLNLNFTVEGRDSSDNPISAEEHAFYYALYNPESLAFKVFEPNLVLIKDNNQLVLNHSSMTLPLSVVKDNFTPGDVLIVGLTAGKTRFFADKFLPLNNEGSRRDNFFNAPESIGHAPLLVIDSDKLATCLAEDDCDTLVTMNPMVGAYNVKHSGSHKLLLNYDLQVVDTNESEPVDDSHCSMTDRLTNENESCVSQTGTEVLFDNIQHSKNLI